MVKSESPNVYISTSGFIYDSWRLPDVFYPENVPSDQCLEFYSSVFDSLTVTSTFFGQPSQALYERWIDKVSKNQNFKFLILAPKNLTQNTNLSKAKLAWDEFWTGICTPRGKKGGCEVLSTAGVLGCVILQFSSKFICDKRNMGKLEKIYKFIPKNVRVSFDFRHWSWWESRGADIFVSNKPNVCVCAPYVENGLVDFGWAGNLPSTRVMAKKPGVPVVTKSDFVHISFNGTYGSGTGSYDAKGFLERTSAEIENLKKVGVKDVFCSFNNFESTFCYPLPALVLSGVVLHPKIRELPFYAKVDKPSCLHDGLRLKEIIRLNARSKYQIGEDGYVVVKFKHTS